MWDLVGYFMGVFLCAKWCGRILSGISFEFFSSRNKMQYNVGRVACACVGLVSALDSICLLTLFMI